MKLKRMEDDMKPTQRLLDDLREGETAYPIYNIRVRWSQDRKPDREYCDEPWNKGLPEDRCWNGTSWYNMYRQEVPLQTVEAEVEAWWPEYIKEFEEFNPSEPKVSINIRRFETWCQSWFAHWTFDKGLDDRAVLAGFQRYVDRTKQVNEEEGVWTDGYLNEPYCLMGAEDSWRWHGRTHGQPGDEQTSPPCRCPGCKGRGVITIGH